MNTSNDHNLRCIEVFVVHQVQGQVDLCRNYNSAFVLGSKNLRVSTVEDHSLSYMYKWAMMLFNKSQGREYSPTAQALSYLDEETACQLKRKFDIACFICKEHMPFTKMKPLCGLQERAGVDMVT